MVFKLNWILYEGWMYVLSFELKKFCFVIFRAIVFKFSFCPTFKIINMYKLMNMFCFQVSLTWSEYILLMLAGFKKKTELTLLSVPCCHYDSREN